MQIKINVISLSDYYEKISRGIFDFLQAFKECCPICYAKNCAVRIGFYFRMAVDIETGLIIEKLMIIRFLCRRKGKPKIKDRTFSLLPSSLIPYRRFSIKSLMTILKEKLVIVQRVIEIPGSICNYFASLNLDFSFETCYIYNYLKVFKNTISKLNIFLRKTLKENIHLTTSREGLVFAYSYITEFICPQTNQKGAEALDLYYYQESGGYLKNAQFLFGTPYQHR